jgi:hypothetical protein
MDFGQAMGNFRFVTLHKTLFGQASDWVRGVPEYLGQDALV